MNDTRTLLEKIDELIVQLPDEHELTSRQRGYVSEKLHQARSILTMQRNFKEVLAKLDWQANNNLTRAQCLEILNAPHKAKLEPFADRFGVSIALVRHVRYKCRAMLKEPSC